MHPQPMARDDEHAPWLTGTCAPARDTGRPSVLSVRAFAALIDTPHLSHGPGCSPTDTMCQVTVAAHEAEKQQTHDQPVPVEVRGGLRLVLPTALPAVEMRRTAIDWCTVALRSPCSWTRARDAGLKALVIRSW